MIEKIDEEDKDIISVALMHFREILETEGNLYPFTTYEIDVLLEKIEKTQ
jgi:hypothetical protein